MKKCGCGLIIWAALLNVLAVPLFSQSAGLTTDKGGAQPLFDQNYAGSAPREANPQVPIPEILPEPQFTQGDSNYFFWKFPVNTFLLGGKTISIDSCKIIYETASDSIFKLDLKEVPSNQYPMAGEGRVLITLDLPEKIRWFRARMIAPGDGPFGAYGNWSEPQKSTGDKTPPQLTNFAVVDAAGSSANANGWFKNSSLRLLFTLQDRAGLYRAYLRGAVTQDTLFKTPDGMPGPSPVNVSWRLRLPEGEHALSIGAGDAAYTPESHGAGKDGKEAAHWEIRGNRNDALMQVVIRVDQTPPQIDLAKVDTLYALLKDVEITLRDALSGIDVASVAVSLKHLSKTVRLEPCTPFDDGCYRLMIRFSNLVGDVTDTLTVTAADKAGNIKSENKVIRFVVQPPVLQSFRLRDGDWGSTACLAPDSAYTNSPIVRIDELRLAPNSKPAASLRIVNSADPAQTAVKAWPSGGSLSFDLREIFPSLTSEQRISLTIHAVDAYGNAQEGGIARSIIYDDVAPQLQRVEIIDTTSAADHRRRAEAGWTNDRTVRVRIETPDRLAKIEQFTPIPECRNGTREFFLLLPAADGSYQFACQAADSAGNTTDVVSAFIRLDTQIGDPNADDFQVGDDLENAGYVKITLLRRQNWPDLSRMIINGSVFTTGGNYSISVPESIRGYTVALIDSAGNESRAVQLSPPCPQFGLIMADTSKAPNDAQVGFINDYVIGWALTNANFRLEKLQNVVFYNASMTRLASQPDADHGFFDLRSLYPLLSSGDSCKIYAKVVVANWPQCDPDSLAEAMIVYDEKRPVIDQLTLGDNEKDPFAAAAGFTNTSRLIVVLNTEDKDVSFMEVAGTAGDQIDGQPLPHTAEFKDRFVLTLGTQKDSETHRLTARLKDYAGNWSEPFETRIHYLKQSISIPAKLDTVVLSFPAPGSIPISFSVNCRYPNYLRHAFITEPRGNTDSIHVEWNQAAGKISFSLNEPNEGLYRIVLADSAGNGSNEAQLYVDIQEPPRIKLTLFDAASFPGFTAPSSVLPEDWQRSDSLYTNGSVGKLVVMTRRIGGDWHKIQISAGDQLLVDDKVADESADYDLRMVPLPTIGDGLIAFTIRARVENRQGAAEADSASIIYDKKAPQLLRFVGEPLVSAPTFYRFTWEGFDESIDGSPAEPAGLLLIERWQDDTGKFSKSQTFYFPVTGTSGQDTLTLLNEIGVHTLTAFPVDKADADQYRPDSTAMRVGRGELGWITHAGNSISFQVRYNPIEVANFPNPFDPTREYTSLIFPINNDAGSVVRITILDAFGRLVHKKEVTCSKGFQVGDEGSNPDLRWDGRNDRGEIVANGGYICIIDILNTGERYTRKIAVLKQGH